MVTVIGFLLFAGLVALVAHIVKPAIPLWIAVLFIFIIELIRVLPLGK